MSNILRAWRASFVRRWHTNPDLCDSVDYISGHQGRVALILLLLKPDASPVLLRHALTHDQGEIATGDVSYTVKRTIPALTTALSILENEEIDAQGFRLGNLTERETRFLKLCDWLDAYLWMLRHASRLHRRSDWAAQRQEMLETAGALGVADAVEYLLEQAEAGL